MAEQPTEFVALLSIHPEYAEGIMSGAKQVEFRRVAPKAPVSQVVVYATAPVGAVVGYFEVERIDRASPEQLWRKHGKVGGISREKFFEYFEGAGMGVAFVVKRAWRCPLPIRLRSDGLPARPPQSFMYLDSEVLGRLGARKAPRAARACA